MNKNPIPYYSEFSKITGGGVSAGVFLSYVFHVTQANLQTGPVSPLFLKTQEEITEYTGLTRSEQETARRYLREAGILEEKRLGIPSRLHSWVNCQRVLQLLNPN